mmetsp:Transcript_9282/g.20649  ORF Transcript_9282/g.20649 Transcript_9282/m.20649 type:complete len:300 (-) Transcript_9282:145-1044(-)|eukprot:CAMPEP_0170613050 /NCGR_PEP_ID=MMETSP0224-20130122/24060_1 /TAXON_ID=285029 /ORGANISM="Togula jolla, Strain CCCM 725" /LENGTH=299 /DNA_ID=CAMNT_0010938615 /DNA_START=53 /DNA_END=952 /DNA_ORIENTATION=-
MWFLQYLLACLSLAGPLSSAFALKFAAFQNSKDADAEEERPSGILDRRRYFMDYMPDRDLVACACARCGTSALVRTIYKELLGEPGLGNATSAVDTGADLRDLWHPNWKGRWRVILDSRRQEKIMHKAYSYALVRDPIERLISSWKAKLRCKGDDESAAAAAERRAYVKEVRDLQGIESNETCMDLETFSQALFDIHQHGDESFLNPYFMPQNLACFWKYPPSRWSKVVDITHVEGFSHLLRAISKSPGAAPGVPKQGNGNPVMVTPRALEQLRVVTNLEYALLRDYLAPSRVQSDSLF